MATPAEFFDPFVKAALSETPIAPDTVFPNIQQQNFVRDKDTESFLLQSAVDRDAGLVTGRSYHLPIKGQGTIAVKSNAESLLRFAVTSDKGSLGGRTLHLDIGTKEVLLYFDNTAGPDGSRINIKYDLKSPSTEDIALNPGHETIYWLSIDSNNGKLKYGKYLTNETMTLIEASLKSEDVKGRLVWNKPTEFSWIETLAEVNALQDPLKNGKILHTVIDPLPVVISLPPFVISADQISLNEIARGIYTVPANLPEACQTLYGNVAGAKIVLDDDSFPEFSKAIQRSCTTPGLWAYEKLLKKADEFDDKKESYLRITLGFNMGDSPGIPYVLEIWPSQHYSPIHDHGQACAIIKVLHGTITCNWYNTLETTPVQVGSGKLEKGMITWIGEENYQIHKLVNESEEVCCTIQSYKYEANDKVHYDGFNWIDSAGSVKKFIPNGDMDFVLFRHIMQEEWKAYSKTTNGNGHV